MCLEGKEREVVIKEHRRKGPPYETFPSRAWLVLREEEGIPRKRASPASEGSIFEGESVERQTETCREGLFGRKGVWVQKTSQFWEKKPVTKTPRPGGRRIPPDK